MLGLKSCATTAWQFSYYSYLELRHGANLYVFMSVGANLYV